jgi:hypothetical protein
LTQGHEWRRYVGHWDDLGMVMHQLLPERFALQGIMDFAFQWGLLE